MPKSPKISSESPQRVDLVEVERILDFMQKHGLEEFEHERNGVRIRLRKASAPGPVLPRAAAMPQPTTTEVVAPVQEQAPAAPTRPTPGASSEDLHIIKSPIVGTFYGAPNPGAEAFVSVGSRVEVGQVLCIIEAMKLMNEIESDAAGEVARVFVENGHPVEYGQALFGIRPHRGK
ncbi:MAG TPA: acetyl-CoA carboxylase biotin carboxyl carrier protein [Candidatus Acidoferrum sp.]|nr:acetyl-CoA carboxylase biotin carboxyl carrier protein [Candidatus Acidoferrum sp.]